MKRGLCFQQYAINFQQYAFNFLKGELCFQQAGQWENDHRQAEELFQGDFFYFLKLKLDR